MWVYSVMKAPWTDTSVAKIHERSYLTKRTGYLHQKRTIPTLWTHHEKGRFAVYHDKVEGKRGRGKAKRGTRHFCIITWRGQLYDN